MPKESFGNPSGAEASMDLISAANIQWGLTPWISIAHNCALASKSMAANTPIKTSPQMTINATNGSLRRAF
jgi:hypothetical protein